MEANPVVRMIAAALTPYVGETMAWTSIQSHCKRLGLDASRLGRAELEQLLEQIGKGLNVFIGRDKSAGVMRGIRASIGSVQP